MKRYPAIPTLDDAPDDLLAGHLWLLEWIDGAHLRFRMAESGLLRFGDRETTYDDPDELPAGYGRAVRHVREAFDREGLRRAVDDVTDVVFFGVATRRETVDYDWNRLPPFLGHDVWNADRGAFRPPDAAERIFDAFGLHPVNAFERERNARDFHPDRYTVPSSAWRDGPAAGVVVRNKRGDRGLLRRSEAIDDAERGAREAGVEHADSDPTDLAAAYATPRRFERLVDEMRARGEPVTVEGLAERVFEDVLRETHRWVGRGDGDGRGVALRAELTTRTRSFINDHEGEW